MNQQQLKLKDVMVFNTPQIRENVDVYKLFGEHLYRNKPEDSDDEDSVNMLKVFVEIDLEGYRTGLVIWNKSPSAAATKAAYGQSTKDRILLYNPDNGRLYAYLVTREDAAPGDPYQRQRVKTKSCGFYEI